MRRRWLVESMMSMGEWCYIMFAERFLLNAFVFCGNAIDSLFCFLTTRVFRYMNVTLKDAVFIDRCGKYHAYDNFMVPARMVKFIHVPGQVN